ncbi:MAG: hypothetical protein ABR577_13795 [Pyrinomonadaceae bacterium]
MTDTDRSAARGGDGSNNSNAQEVPRRRRADQDVRPPAPFTGAAPVNNRSARGGDAASLRREVSATRKIDGQIDKPGGEGARVSGDDDDSAIKRRRMVMSKTATAARERVEDNLRPRVEKLRQTSSAVLDEAADDPGVRFVLVAAGLFLIALALVIISELLG